MHHPADHTSNVTRRARLRTVARGTELVDEIFIVQHAEMRGGKGNPYLSLVFADAAGRLDARLFDANENDLMAFPQGEPVQVTAVMDVWQNRPQLVVRRFGVPDPGRVTEAELVPPPGDDPKALKIGLLELLGTMRDPWLCKLRDAYAHDDDFFRRFCDAPGATSYHHAWPHGLLEHTLSAMRLADTLCAHYPRANRDLVLMAVFLHDSGKADELARDGLRFRYTPSGNLIGHITLGVSRLERMIDAIPHFPRMLGDELAHCIVSHHGQQDRGSPKEPMTREALIVHHVECLDSELATFDDEEQSHRPDPSGEPVFGWSRRFRRRLLLRPDPPSEAPSDASDNDDSPPDTRFEHPIP